MWSLFHISQPEPRRKIKKSFTLLEIIFALALSSIIMLTVMNVMVQSLKMYNSQNNTAKLDNQAYRVIGLLEKDIESASGVNVSASGSSKLYLNTKDYPITIEYSEIESGKGKVDRYVQSALNKTIFDSSRDQATMTNFIVDLSKYTESRMVTITFTLNKKTAMLENYTKNYMMELFIRCED